MVSCFFLQSDCGLARLVHVCLLQCLWWTSAVSRPSILSLRIFWSFLVLDERTRVGKAFGGDLLGSQTKCLFGVKSVQASVLVLRLPLPRKQGSRISMLNFNGCLMFMSDVLAKVSASRELFISQTLRQSFFIDNQCAKSKSKQTCFSCLFAAVDVAQGRLPLGAGWAGQDWLLTSRRPQKHKVKVGFFQFDLKKDLDFILYQL